MKYLILIYCLFFTSCSILWKKSEFETLKYPKNVANEEYATHLVNLGKDYLVTPGIREIYLSRASKRYLNNIFKRIVVNNELLLNKDEKPTFHIIKDSTPFYFTLPKSHYFFSSSLIDKYLGNEELFASAITYMTIKSHRLLFEKKLVVPIGYISTKKILSLTRLPLEEKEKVNKWAYYVLKRAGFDPYAYLIWLQSQNKNSLDFTMQHGSSQNISREEFSFKKFISEVGIQEKTLYRKSSNSSKAFYKIL